jgi:hypothetical protein
MQVEEEETCDIWGYDRFVCVLKFDSPLPKDNRVNILSTADSLRHHCKLGGDSASISCTSVYRVSATIANSAGTPPRSPAPVSTEDRSVVGGSSDGQDERPYVGGGLQPGAALVVVRLTVVAVPPRSTAPAVAGCRLIGCSVVGGRPLRSRAVAGVSQRVRVGSAWGPFWPPVPRPRLRPRPPGGGGGGFPLRGGVWAE